MNNNNNKLSFYKKGKELEKKNYYDILVIFLGFTIFIIIYFIITNIFYYK